MLEWVSFRVLKGFIGVFGAFLWLYQCSLQKVGSSGLAVPLKETTGGEFRVYRAPMRLL